MGVDAGASFKPVCPQPTAPRKGRQARSRTGPMQTNQSLSQWMPRVLGGLVGLALLVVLLFLMHRAGLLGSLFQGPEAEGCEVYLKLDFDQHKGNFRPVDATQLDRSDDSCGGKALRLKRLRPGGDFGATLPLFLEGVAGLKIV